MNKYTIRKRIIENGKTVGYVLDTPYGKEQWMLIDDVYKLAYNYRVSNARIKSGKLHVIGTKQSRVECIEDTEGLQRLREERHKEVRETWSHLDFEYFIAKHLHDDIYEVKTTDGRKTALSTTEIFELAKTTEVRGVNGASISDHWLADEFEEYRNKLIAKYEVKRTKNRLLGLDGYEDDELSFAP